MLEHVGVPNPDHAIGVGLREVVVSVPRMPAESVLVERPEHRSQDIREARLPWRHDGRGGPDPHLASEIGTTSASCCCIFSTRAIGLARPSVIADPRESGTRSVPSASKLDATGSGNRP